MPDLVVIAKVNRKYAASGSVVPLASLAAAASGLMPCMDGDSMQFRVECIGNQEFTRFIEHAGSYLKVANGIQINYSTVQTYYLHHEQNFLPFDQGSDGQQSHID